MLYLYCFIFIVLLSALRCNFARKGALAINKVGLAALELANANMLKSCVTASMLPC